MNETRSPGQEPEQPHETVATGVDNPPVSDRIVMQFNRKAAIEILLPNSGSQPPNPEPEPVVIDVDGQAVAGRIVYRSRREVTVEILSPYHGYRHSRACNLMSLLVNDYRGAQGEPLARRLLAQLYQGCLQLDTALRGQGEQIRREYQQLQDELAAVPPVPAATAQFRRERRAALKAGQCGQAEYREALDQLRTEQQDREAALKACADRFFERLAFAEPEAFRREETLAILSGRQCLLRTSPHGDNKSP